MVVRAAIALAAANSRQTDALARLHVALLMLRTGGIARAQFARDHRERVAIVTGVAAVAAFTAVAVLAFADVVFMRTLSVERVASLGVAARLKTGLKRMASKSSNQP